jgi:S1-C subfamily serine protease
MFVKTAIYFAFIWIFCTTKLAYGQREEKIFYDDTWKGTTEAKASYYRVLSYDKNGNPIGKVKDYYITGELQGDIDGAIYIDKKDDSKSKFTGKSVSYYRSGKKSFESIWDIHGNIVSETHWWENGNKKSQASYKNRLNDGEYSAYYENGKLRYKALYQSGILIDKWVMECDEFDRCQKVFVDKFDQKENWTYWKYLKESDSYSQIIEGQGLLLETRRGLANFAWMNLPIDINENFSIETELEFKSGDTKTAYGIIWGLKDWDNYYYFYISANGQYCLGGKSDGLLVEFSKWSKTAQLNLNTAKNKIQVNKIGEKMYYSINSKIVFESDFYGFRGNNIGFLVDAGDIQVIFNRLVVRQDVNANLASSDVALPSQWKGNGSGFFIDTNGHIVTNYHVVENASEIDFSRNGFKKSYKAVLVNADKHNDLAIIKIEDEIFKLHEKVPYRLKTHISDVGSSVFALGYPLALSGMGDEVKFTDGKISSKTGYDGNISTYQISVPVQPGNSGGPLFDYDGNLIGVISSKIMQAENVSYAIKSSYLMNLLDVMPEIIVNSNEEGAQNQELTEKIKLFSDFVVLIKVK